MEGIENKDLLQAVFDSASNGIAVMQAVYDDNKKVKDFSILLFNAFTLNWIGDIDYKDKLYGDVFPMVRETGILDKFKTVAETGIPANFESKYTGEGMNHWFRFSAVKKGDLLVVTTEDISERKLTENALAKVADAMEKQQRLYDSITNNTPDLVYVFDLEYRFTYANKALLAMWGKSAEDAIGKGLRENGYEEWHALMHEREIDEIVLTKKNIRGTVAFPHAELGSRIYDYILTPVINEQGDVEAIAGITRDISGFKQTEEKLLQSEARLISLIDQTPAATLVLRGDDLVVEQINAGMLLLIGKGKEIIGKPLIQTMPELEGQYIWDQVVKVYQQGIPFDQSEVLVPHNRTGVMKDYYYNIAYRPFYENGTITGMIQVAVDATEQVVARKNAEASENRYRALSETLELQVNERTKELQRSNEDLQQFAHVASHDLKEPVRKIKTFTDRLEKNLDGKLDDDGSKYIERIHTATDRMFSMIDGVLTYSTANAGLQNCEEVSLDEVINNIRADLEVTLSATGGSIMSSGLPVLQGAPILLYQLFYNLINNSIKFVTPGTAPLITISSEQALQHDERFARIILQDNGIGFEDEYAERIFDTFTRLNSKDKYEGTGLGLALCKKIAERHSGSITASGRPGKGAVFTIMLPLQQKQPIV